MFFSPLQGIFSELRVLSAFVMILTLNYACPLVVSFWWGFLNGNRRNPRFYVVLAELGCRMGRHFGGEVSVGTPKVSTYRCLKNRHIADHALPDARQGAADGAPRVGIICRQDAENRKVRVFGTPGGT